MRGTLLLFFLVAALVPAVAQEKPEPAVTGYAAGYFGLTPDDESVPIGVVGIDHKAWHFLARYGYEDRDTFSAWAGRIFEFGDDVAVALTPMVWVVVGLTDGVAPGPEFALDWGRLGVYNESELIIPFDGSESYFYAWGNTSYRVADRFQPGFSIQRLRVFQSDRELDRGISIGAEFGRLAATEDGKELPSQLELVRLTIPRRVYSNDQMKAAADKAAATGAGPGHTRGFTPLAIFFAGTTGVLSTLLLALGFMLRKRTTPDTRC